MNKKQVDKIVEECIRGSHSAFERLSRIMSTHINIMSCKWQIKHLSIEDLKQELLIKLYFILEDYNPELGTFQSFAVSCFRYHLMSLMTKAENSREFNIIDDLLAEEEGRSHFSDVMLAPDNTEKLVRDMKIDYDELLGILCGMLTPLEQKILDSYLREIPYVQIVKELKSKHNMVINKKMVDNSIERIKAKARELFLSFSEGHESDFLWECRKRRNRILPKKRSQNKTGKHGT